MLSIPIILTAFCALISAVFLNFFPVRGDTFVLLYCLGFVALQVLGLVTNFHISSYGCLHLLSLHCFLLSTFTSVYRISPWHPLYTFPGPFWNRLSSIPSLLMVSWGKRHSTVANLHKRYGKVVRTGPNTISFNSNIATGDIYKCIGAWDKSNAYTPGRIPGRGLFFMCGRKEHDSRRRHWADAFHGSSLTSFEPIMNMRVRELIDCILRRGKSDSLSLGDCIQHWSYDFMGSIVFGSNSGLELMHSGDKGGFVRNGQLATAVFECLGEIPGLLDIFTRIPVLTTIQNLQKLADSFIQMQQVDSEADSSNIPIAAHLMRKDTDGHTILSRTDLTLDVMFAIQAGSDTTSGVLTLAFYHLLANPTYYDKLQQELDIAFSYPSTDTTMDADTLSELPYLNAVINESLRLGAPFPGLPRVVPKGGATIDGVFIPENTIVGVPAWSQHISVDNFYPYPERFMPERWLARTIDSLEVRTNRSAIMTFSFGPFGCLGKSLALLELRVVIASVVHAFNMSFALDFDRMKFMKEMVNMRTTIFNYPLLVCACPRS